VGDSLDSNVEPFDDDDDKSGPSFRSPLFNNFFSSKFVILVGLTVFN
jgi:hypothetical protein